jgi:hypothetical protein
LGFLFYGRYLLPIATAAVAVSLFTLAHGARERRGFGPFCLALLGSVGAASGKFLLFSPTVLWAGLGFFVFAAGWNAWPKRQVACVTCAPQDLDGEQQRTIEVRTMTRKRTVEVFSAGCAVCHETVSLVRRLACPSCDVSVLDMQDATVAARAKNLGVRSVPAVAIDGKLAACCAGGGPDEGSLRAAGLGQSIS